jgi:putative folate metabolism gamma-glutamate ligase
MKATSYKTHKILPKESLKEIVDRYLPTFPDNSIIAITSKIVSLCQNRVVLKKDITEKFQLIQQESDLYLEGAYSQQYGIYLTVKNNILIPTAGIDESNGNGYYILYPQDIQSTAIEIWQHLRQRDPDKKIGILITDSHTTPLRRGVTGIALGWCGFKPLYNYIGMPDIYGHPLRVTMINLLDSLAATAVYVMGEGSEQTPLAIIENAPKIEFQDTPPSKEEVDSITISLTEDLYAPLLTDVPWKKGGA